MPSTVETLLTTIGLPSEEVTQIVSLPDGQDFDITPIVERVKTNYRTQFENDPTFFSKLTLETLPPEVKKTLEKNQYGRAATITRDKLIKGLGMSEADYQDLTDEEKEKLELFVPKIAEKYSKTKAGSKELQEQLIEARQKLESLNGVEERLKNQYETETNKRINEVMFTANLIAELSAIKGLKIPAADIAKAASEIISSKYGYERVGDTNIELRQKDNPAMKVLKNNSSQQLTLREALAEIAAERNWINTSDLDDGKEGGGKVEILPDNSKLVIAPHLKDKISKKIASEKKA